MTTETVHTTLQFAGEWPWWAGGALALALGAAAWLLYRRELRSRPVALRFALPTLRALAVAMIVLLLAGPVLHHRKVIGQLSRVLLFVDASRSMGLSDASMEAGRKIRILQSLGLLRADAVSMELPHAGEALGEAGLLARKAGAAQNDEADWSHLVADFSARLNEARQALQAGGASDRLESFDKELAQPAYEIEHREIRQIDDRQRAAHDLANLGPALERWRNEVAEKFRQAVDETAGVTASPVAAALQRFDSMPRWERLQALLTEGEKGKLLARLSEKHNVQVYAIEGGAAKEVWQSASGAAFGGLSKPLGETTDLATPLEAVLGGDRPGEEHAAAVLFTDGQHNEGGSPVEAAKVLGGRQFPIYPVGLGATSLPHDLAVLTVQAPDSVFAEDHVRGQISLKDDMPPGLSFTLSIRDGDKVLWDQQMSTQGTHLRTVPFEFAIGEAVQERMKNEKTGVQVSGLPLELKVAVTPVPGDGEPGNDSLNMRVRAVTQKRKILLLDGRPRWETRYLRNMFERDDQWEVNAVIAGVTGGEGGLARGTEPEQFPSDLGLIASYDLIILGEVPVELWKPGELEALRDFVGQRGGALVLIDGPRGALKGYEKTPLGPLIPVEWKNPNGVRDQIKRLIPTEPAQALAPFALVPERDRNLEVWRGLPPPHWLADATALPGAEVLVEAEVAGARSPAVVSRPFGAGRVLYHAFEDSWRWRYEVADQYHVKYWNQLASWISEIPFAVRDKFVSLDAGAITYRPGESAELRVRLRDGQGRPVNDAVADAVLYRDGLRSAAIRLLPDENAGGLYHGRTAALEPGEYEVAVESPAIAEQDALARTSFKVEARATGELSQLQLNEELLRQMAQNSGGQYLREENAGQLIDLLAPLSHGQVIESETVLAQSYWWFVPVVCLLTLEWILRKRAGML